METAEKQQGDCKETARRQVCKMSDSTQGGGLEVLCSLISPLRHLHSETGSGKGFITAGHPGKWES